MSRFVRPETLNLKLSDGDWLLVKRRLNSGEQRAAFARMYLAGIDGTLRVNPLQAGMARITAYLLDWSLTDDDGKPVVIREQPIDSVVAALDSLSPEDFAEVTGAIEKHEQAMAAESAEKKRIRAGEPTSAPTSPSLSDVDGGTNGSGILTATSTAFS